MTARERAEELRSLHEAPELLVLVNVWDAASARTAAAVPGCRALATASWAMAAAHGVADGALAAADMLAAVGRIAGAVEVPVSADLEAGYEDVTATVVAALATGVVGVNLEDGAGDPDEHAARVTAARAAGDAVGVPLVVNARTDVFLGAGDPAAVVGDAISRGRHYLAAGADCVFAIGLAEPEIIGRLAAAFDGRLSVLAGPASPSFAELQRLGVARVTFGPGFLGVAMAALAREAETVLSGGPAPADLAFRPPAA